MSNAKQTFDWSSQFRGTIQPARLVGKNLKDVEKAFNDVVENRMNENIASHLRLIGLDANQYGIPLDTMIVGMEVPGKFFAFHALAIDDGKKTFGTMQGQLGNEQFTVDKLPCLSFTEEVNKKLLVQVAEAIKVPGETKRTMMCGSSILPVMSVNLEDENAVTSVLVSIYTSIETIVNDVVDKNVLNVADASSNEYLETRREHTATNAKDEYDQPLRADMQATLTARKANTNEMQAMQSGTELALVTGYLDLLPYQNPNAASFNNFGAFGAQAISPELAGSMNNIETANVVITSVNPGVNQDNSNMLLGFASAFDAFNNQYWWATTLNPFRQPAKNLHSIKGLGYDIAERFRNQNIDYKALPIEDPDFKEEDWRQILNQYISKQISFSFDVALGSASSWRYRFLTEASRENDAQAKQQDSYSWKVLQLADTLTNYKFGEIYARNGGSGRPVSRLENRFILMGNYMCQERQEQRDIRDIDRMFLMSNVVQDDPSMMEYVRRWTTAQIDPNLSVEQRIYIQREILTTVAPNANITGYGIRYDFEGAFVKSLLEALVEAGFTTSFNDVVADGNYANYNATYINRSMVSNMGFTAMRNNMYHNQQQGYNAFNPYANF